MTLKVNKKEMEMTKKDNSNMVLGLLGLLFIAFKLTGVIDWSWWFVTMPFWIGLAMLIAIMLGCAIIKILLNK